MLTLVTVVRYTLTPVKEVTTMFTARHGLILKHVINPERSAIRSIQDVIKNTTSHLTESKITFVVRRDAVHFCKDGQSKLFSSKQS